MLMFKTLTAAPSFMMRLLPLQLSCVLNVLSLHRGPGRTSRRVPAHRQHGVLLGQVMMHRLPRPLLVGRPQPWVAGDRTRSGVAKSTVGIGAERTTTFTAQNASYWPGNTTSPLSTSSFWIRACKRTAPTSNRRACIALLGVSDERLHT
jgi:hypothetical protein